MAESKSIEELFFTISDATRTSRAVYAELSALLVFMNQEIVKVQNEILNVTTRDFFRFNAFRRSQKQS